MKIILSIIILVLLTACTMVTTDEKVNAPLPREMQWQLEAHAALPDATLKNLKALLSLFHQAKAIAEKDIGTFLEGNRLLGQEEQYYKPTKSEIKLSVIGDKIKEIIDTTSKKELQHYLEDKSIETRSITYKQFSIGFKDIIGSGRIAQISTPEEITISLTN